VQAGKKISQIGIMSHVLHFSLRNLILMRRQQEIFEDVMIKYGRSFINLFANINKEIEKNIEDDESDIEHILPVCWYNKDFFRWIIPIDRNNDYELVRPQTAIGPYNYIEKLTFSNNTIVHGEINGSRLYYFFAICLDNIVTIYSTYNNGCQMKIVKHYLINANTIIKDLTTEFSSIPYTNFISELLGYNLENIDYMPYTIILNEHSFWLPTPILLIDYLSLLQESSPNTNDNISIQQLISDLNTY